MTKHVFLYALASLALLASGCALLKDSAPAARMTAQYATFKVIDGDPDRAAKVLRLVQDAQSYVTGGPRVSIAALEQAARDRIPWQRLNPGDHVLIDAILTEARKRLELKIGAGVLDPDQRVQLSEFLAWIKGAADAVAQR